jgi:hypothetical protein
MEEPHLSPWGRRAGFFPVAKGLCIFFAIKWGFFGI